MTSPTLSDRVIIAGGSGFLGVNLARHLLDLGREVVLISRNTLRERGAGGFAVCEIDVVCDDGGMSTRSIRVAARAFSLSLAVALFGSLWVGLTGCAATSASVQRELPTGENTVMAPTVVYLIRHTETDPNAGRDPELTAVGVAKAELLARLLADEPISAIFVTATIRSYASAAPIATAHGIEFTEYAPLDAEALAARIRADHAGSRVLVVAHSNTVAPILRALGGPDLPDLLHNEYDRFFAVMIEPGGLAHTLQLRF